VIGLQQVRCCWSGRVCPEHILLSSKMSDTRVCQAHAANQCCVVLCLQACAALEYHPPGWLVVPRVFVDGGGGVLDWGKGTALP
jgi:hypothetical protein